MSYRINAALAIARRRLLEAFIHPGYYVSLAISLAIGFAFIAGFVRSIDSSGFDYKLTSLYAFAGGILSGAFGDGVVANAFADGPFLVAVNVAFLPVLLYLSMTSVYRFGTEKASGTIELLTYGPSDGTSYFLGSILKDMVLTVGTLLIFVLFFVLSAAVDNLALTQKLISSTALLLLVSLAVYSYGVLVSVLTDSANTALALFMSGLVLLALSLIGSYAIVTGYVRSLSTVAAWVIQWFSPFYYWSLGTRASIGHDAVGYVIGIAGLAALSAALLVASHYIIRFRGVRP